MHRNIEKVTAAIIQRSQQTRAAYLQKLAEASAKGPHRGILQCGNLAHGFAGCSIKDKSVLRELNQANIAIVSSYNDILSAHKPYECYPQLLKSSLEKVGCVGQFAGGVPAMCDGVTQGQPGMELSLFSRDIIAMAAGIALSHNLFDGGLMLGICDKIVPGLLIAALHFGHLPFVFVPAGPMPSGISNNEKARIRKLHAEGKVGDRTLLEVEEASYHSQGTCTFYGTANSNQLLVELMGLHLPGASFVNPNTRLREELTKAAAYKVASLTHLTDNYLPIGQLIDEKSIVNAIVGLLASGGSTNHTMHLIAIARAAGIQVNWDDFSNLSAVVPLITRMYPNGLADINHFQRAGGMAFLIQTLLEAGLLHEEVNTIMGFGLNHYTKVPVIQECLEEDSSLNSNRSGDKLHSLTWIENSKESLDPNVLRSADNPFKSTGGLQVLSGNLGRAVIKTSSLSSKTEKIEAPAIVFFNQEELEEAFKKGELNKDFIAVIPFQGPRACGMPELHRLTPLLSVQQDKGFKVALVTDGRMSGASGRVPAAIHVTPEALDNGMIAKVRTGDRVLLDSQEGILKVLLTEGELASRESRHPNQKLSSYGLGREMFAMLRTYCSGAEEGACSLFSKDSE